MTRWTGTATLEYLGMNQLANVSVDLDTSTVEVRHSSPSFEEGTAMMLADRRCSAKAILKAVELVTPIGAVTCDQLPDFLVLSFTPGTYTSNDSTVRRALRGDTGVARLVLHPSCSRLDFRFQPFDGVQTRCELLLVGETSSIPCEQELHLNPGKASFIGDEAGIIVRSDQPLGDRQEVVQLCLSVMQGGLISIRGILEDETLTINLAAHHGRCLDPLPKDPSEAGNLVQGIYDFLRAQTPADWARWKKAIHFYLEGLGGVAPLEVRAINLLTFLEIVDGSATLSKNSVSSLLSITSDNADLICRTRNRLVHHGDYIGAAVVASASGIAGFGAPSDGTVFPIDRADERKTGVSFFFHFASLLSRLWIEKAGFKGEWNDYSKYAPA
jgi:hypothetical protein